jgi:1-aminocyclopropane-1-carboxylate deaminase/D-cysteine desulfhydrase-like pyridoxal-dependent ACC family enzyme
MTPAALLRTRLDGFPRRRLALLPTPIHELPRLSERLGVRILVKRDDMTGLAFGGNKIRQLEFFMGAALAAGADTLVAGGSHAQSNHARACAAAARASGLESLILIRPGGARGADPDGGNAQLTAMLASEVRVAEDLERVPRGDRLGEVAGRVAIFEAAADSLRREGRTPYVLAGSSTGLGVLGYVAATLEIEAQRVAEDLGFSTIFLSSLGVTQAGLEVGRRVLGAPWTVAGMAYQPSEGAGAGWVRSLMGDAAEMLGLDVDLDREPVVNDDNSTGPAYGVSSAESLAALALAAREDALLLDPVYSAKGFAGMLRWIEEGRVAKGDTALLLHTGGLPAIYAYQHELRDALTR